MFKRHLSGLLCLFLFAMMMAGCGMIPDIPDIPDLPGIGEGEGGQFIAYFEDTYGLTIGIEYEDEAAGVVRIHLYATEYLEE